MPESMFGPPLQHLLPSQPQANTGPSSSAPDPLVAPVQLAPLQFKDFRFNSIGKQPELLSRISLPQPDNTDYHSPTPSPTSAIPFPFTNDFRSKPPSRPTLLQQLAGSDFGPQDGRNAQANQSSGSLASRIQSNSTMTTDIANTTRGTTSRFPSPPLRVDTARRSTEDTSLIPPVEVLHQLPDSSPPTPASWAPVLEPLDVHSPASSIPLANTTMITNPQSPTPVPVDTNNLSKEPAEPLPSIVVDATMQDLQSSPSATATIDSFQVRRERLQSVSTKLANLTSSLAPPSFQSPSPDLSSVMHTNASTTPQSRPSSPPLILHYPYETNQSSGRVELSINDAQPHTNDSSLALVRSPTTLAREYQNRSTAIAAAVQNLSSLLDAAHLAQIDNENTLTHRIRTFDERCAAFEQTQRAGEAMLQQGFQELQEKRVELNARETLLDSLEKEIKAREEARKVLLAKRQAQEEEKRAAEAKRVQELQEQIATAMNELGEIEALKAKYQSEQLASETVQDDLPTEPQEGMNEEERTMIKSRNDLLCVINRLRQTYTDNVQKLEEANRALRGLGGERRKREETERRRVAEEKRLRALAKIEAEKKRLEAESYRKQAQPLAEQQAHAEAQARALGRAESTNGQTVGHLSQPKKVFGAPHEQGITDTRMIRAAREADFLSLETINAMNVDDDREPSLRQSISSSGVHNGPGASLSNQLNQKKDQLVSGGVMVDTLNPKAGGGHPPRKPSAMPERVAEHTPNPIGTPAIPVAAENGHKPTLPTQSTPVLNSALNAEIRPTPDRKRAFSRTPKSQTILDATNRGSQELNIGPIANVSPAQQNVNLRHLKRVRGRVEGSDSGDRSVRTIQVKGEENSCLSPKREERDDEEVPPPASLLPPHSTIIPPPRLRTTNKRHDMPASQAAPSPLFPPEVKEPLSTNGEAEITTEHPRELQDNTTFHATNPPVLPAPFDTTNSLLLSSVYAEPKASEPRNTGERHAQDRGDTTTSEPVSTTLSHELDGEDLSRSNRRFTDEHRRPRNANGSRRVVDHYSPPPRPTVTSPTQSHRPIDPWRSQNSSNGPRAEPMRATSPTAGRKRPSEFNDNDHGHRTRRQRGDVWIAQDHDRERVDPYRPHWDRRPDPDLDERRAAYRAPNSPPDRARLISSDVQRATYDNRTHAPEEPTTSSARLEQSYRRTENDGSHQRYQPSAYTMADQHADDTWAGQTYEPVAVERQDALPDPSLLARMHDTQRFPPRGRGRGEPSRGRGDSGRARGRGASRGGPPLIERLTAGPSSLGDRLS